MLDFITDFFSDLFGPPRKKPFEPSKSLSWQESCQLDPSWTWNEYLLDSLAGVNLVSPSSSDLTVVLGENTKQPRILGP